MKINRSHSSQGIQYILTDFKNDIIFTDDFRQFGYVIVTDDRIELILDDHYESHQAEVEDFLRNY